MRWHQDATFFHSAPVTVTTFWFALEDATVDNGCLWAEPGGHRGPLRERFLRDSERITMEKLDATPSPDDSSAVPLEAKAGTLVCFHGLLPHYSAPNRSQVSHHASTLHATHSHISSLNAALGGTALPAFTPFHLLFACLMGSIVLVWSTLRILEPTQRLGRFDGAARFLFSLWIAWCLLVTGAPVLWLFVLPEFAWGVAQWWPVDRDVSGAVTLSGGGGPVASTQVL